MAFAFACFALGRSVAFIEVGLAAIAFAGPPLASLCENGWARSRIYKVGVGRPWAEHRLQASAGIAPDPKPTPPTFNQSARPEAHPPSSLNFCYSNKKFRAADAAGGRRGDEEYKPLKSRRWRGRGRGGGLKFSPSVRGRGENFAPAFGGGAILFALAP